MPKNPYTGKEMNEDVYDFILQHTELNENLKELNRAYKKDLTSIEKPYLSYLGNDLTDENVEELIDSFAETEKIVARYKDDVAFYEISRNMREARGEYESADYDDSAYLDDAEYKKLRETCEKLGVSGDIVDKSIDELADNPSLSSETFNKSRKLGGEDGAIEYYSSLAIKKANGNKDVNPEQSAAIKKAMEYACKSIFQSEDLTNPGKAYYEKKAAKDKYDKAIEACKQASGVENDRDPIDEETYEKYSQGIRQFEDVKWLYTRVKETYSFPKKDTLSMGLQNAALDKYAEAKERADSHWGITKFFASLLPGIFKETAKDMADEKAWREMLKGAEFTDEDLHVSNAKNDEVNDESFDDYELDYDEEKDVDLSSKLYRNIKENDVEAKAEDKKGVDPNLDKNKGDLQA